VSFEEFPYGEATRGDLTDEIIRSVARTHAVIKGPTGTPLGGGYMSPARRLRMAYDLYANVRPVFSLPNIKGPFSHLNLDLVVIRENSEGEYDIREESDDTGVTVIQRYTKEGCRRIAQFAFEYASTRGRKDVCVTHKSNIIKKAHGMFRDAAYAAAKEFPGISCRDLIIDNFGMQLMRDPAQFDVVLYTNLLGDIFSDIEAGMLHRSLGFAGSLQVGPTVAVAEAVHGTAPDIVGRGVANPAAMMFSTAMLFDYWGETSVANYIRVAIAKTLAANIVTKDVDKARGVPTNIWTDAVIQNLPGFPNLTR
jgi:isocitrate dehydrogenase (NAD+)